MIIKEIESGCWAFRVEDAALHIFQGAAYADAGLTFCAYLLDVGSGFALIGSLPEKYTPALMDELARFTEKSPLLYMICHGTRHDAATVRALLCAHPDVCVIAGTAVLHTLASLGIFPHKTVAVRMDRFLTLGSRTLDMRLLEDRCETPSLYVVEPEAHMLFTADAFGSFGALDSPRVSEVKDRAAWQRGVRQYLAGIKADLRQKVMDKAIKLVQDQAVTKICPALGPVIDSDFYALFPLYREVRRESDRRFTVAVIHTGGSVLGLLAKYVEDGIRSCEHEPAPDVLDLDLASMSRDDILAALSCADAYLFGTEDVDGNAAKSVWDIATSLDRADVQGKRAAVFYTRYAGEHVPDALRAYLASLGMKLDMPDWSVSGVPTENDLKNAGNYGFGIGCAVQGIPNPRAPRLVKCLVCGEIFDASLGACPVCGVGLDQCVPVDQEETVFRNDTDRRYLIIGGCTAGVSAAEAIRQRDATGRIDILSAEDHLPIHRPMLTKGVITEVAAAPETIFIHPAAWYAERDISLHLGVTATAICPEKKAVETADGALWPYDKLILALGAECAMPPFPGREMDGVLTVRHLSDAKDMAERMKTCRNAVVIGGGVLGLEAAGELMRSAIPVTVLEATPQIMWKQVDPASSACLRERMRAAHIDCYEGVSVRAIEGQAGHVTGVSLEDGRFFLADMVIVSCGMKANIGLAADAGVTAERAICVDMFMRTDLPDIFACGDCCAYEGVNYQLAQEAAAQGRVAGANAAGDSSVYFANRTLGMHVEGVGATLYAIGDAGKRPELRYRTVEVRDAVTNRMETYWFANGTLRGAVAVNADEKIQLLTEAVQNRARHSELF